MSGLATTFSLLATSAWLVFVLGFLVSRAHDRMDKVVTGVVHGMAVPARHRLLMLLFDFWGFCNMAIIISAIFAGGYREAAKLVQEPGVRAVAQFCAGGSAFAAGAILVAAGALTAHMARVLREAEAD